MKYALWVLQILLCVQFAFSGSFKLLTPREQLAANPRGGWANDFSAMQVKLIGLAELAGAVGLVVPAATGIAPVLTEAAAGGLALLQQVDEAQKASRSDKMTVALRPDAFADPSELREGVVAAFRRPLPASRAH